eukprot:Selendium_serpulae@DN7367_c0_g1_i1.p1
MCGSHKAEKMTKRTTVMNREKASPPFSTTSESIVETEERTEVENDTHEDYGDEFGHQHDAATTIGDQFRTEYHDTSERAINRQRADARRMARVKAMILGDRTSEQTRSNEKHDREEDDDNVSTRFGYGDEGYEAAEEDFEKEASSDYKSDILTNSVSKTQNSSIEWLTQAEEELLENDADNFLEGLRQRNYERDVNDRRETKKKK